MEDTNQNAAPQQAPSQPSPAQPTTPAASEQPQSPMGQPAQPAMGKKKNKMPLLVGIIVAVLVVAGGAAYGVYAYVTNTPDYLMGKAVDQLSGKTALAAKFTLTSGTSANGVNFSGDIAVRGDSANKSGEAVIGVGSGDTRVAITALNTSDTTYIKFSSLANFGNLMKTFAPDQADVYNTAEFKAALQRVDGMWFALSQSDLQGLVQGTTQSGSVDGLNTQDMQQLATIYNKHQFFKADKTFNDDTIDGVKSAHFTLKIDVAAYKAFLTELKAANLKSFTVTDSDINNAQSDASSFAGKSTVDIWITRDTKEFKQFKIANLEKGSESALTLTMATNLPQFETITKPTNAKPFSDFMTTLLGPAYSQAFDSTSSALQ